MEGSGGKELVIWDDSVIVAPDASPLDFLTAVYRDAGQPMNRRIKCAIAAAQYRHPKLQAAMNINMSYGDRLEQARERSRGAVEARAAGRLLEYVRSGEGLAQAEPEAEPLDRRA
jgi:hypothetical protein